MEELFENLKEGSYGVILKLPDYNKTIRARIKAVYLDYKEWKPVDVVFLEKLTAEFDEIEYNDWVEDSIGTLVKRRKPYKGDLIKVEWIVEYFKLP